MKHKRNLFDKLNTLLFGRDLRITEGEPYTVEREYDYSSYYPVDSYISVQKPEGKLFSVVDFGAKPGEKSFDSAKAINVCIDTCCESGGGTVVVDGGDYYATTIFLKSNVTLFVCEGCSLNAFESGEGFTNRAFISADGCENITITGGGIINGNGHLFGRKPLYDANVTEPDDYIDVIKMRIDYRAQLRFPHPSKYGRLVLLENCSKVHIHNIIFKDSAYWTLRMTKCSKVEIENLVINNNRHVCNTDGIDLMQTSDVEIRHCFISCADDGIVLKNAVWEGCDGAMQNVHISDCEIISCTNAFKIGTETTFPISHVCVENCRFFMTDLYPGSVSGISIESVDGSVVSDITVRNIEMDRCSCALFIRLGNRNRAAEVNSTSASAVEYGVKGHGKGVDKKQFDMKGELQGITVENVNAKDVELPVIIAGFKQREKTKNVKNVTLRNFNMTYRNAPEIIDRRLFIPEYSREYPECWRFRNLPAYKLWARHVEELKTENFNCTPAPDTHREDVIIIK